jgi:hypothetical protein
VLEVACCRCCWCCGMMVLVGVEQPGNPELPPSQSSPKIHCGTVPVGVPARLHTLPCSIQPVCAVAHAVSQQHPACNTGPFWGLWSGVTHWEATPAGLFPQAAQQSWVCHAALCAAKESTAAAQAQRPLRDACRDNSHDESREGRCSRSTLNARTSRSWGAAPDSFAIKPTSTPNPRAEAASPNHVIFLRSRN